MMDFDFAANRLKKDQDALRSRAKRRPQTLASTKATIEAKKRQEYRQKQLERKKEKERLEKLKWNYIQNGFDVIERRLGVVRRLGPKMPVDVDMNISSMENQVKNGGALVLEAASVHGQGDKITLPSSLLSTLASRDLLRTSQEKGQPLFFRLGIRRQGYIFPSSDKMKQMLNDYTPEQRESGSDGDNDRSIQHLNAGDSIMEDLEEQGDGEDNNEDADWEQAYLDELSHEYVSYVYATVVEFTQEEGFIGLPKCISDALLSQPNKNSHDGLVKLKGKFTVDPASISSSSKILEENDVSPMEVDDDNNYHNTSLETKTPGHPAYGSFLVPTDKIEVSLLTNLPLGKKCTLQPTHEAIQNGFYNLKDVKVVLEQSLIRTRGCLNVGDTVHCWHRGKKFDLNVKDLSPSRVKAVSCVNTDVEVDIAAVAEKNVNHDSGNKDNSPKSEIKRNESLQGRTLSGGYRLQSDDKTKSSISPSTTASGSSRDHNLSTSEKSALGSVSEMIKELKLKDISPEPPIDRKENIITVQIRGFTGGKQCRRRFDTSISKMEDIFSYALSEDLVSVDFRLVTRFPRQVFTLTEHGATLLANLNLPPQELFLVEKM